MHVGRAIAAVAGAGRSGARLAAGVLVLTLFAAGAAAAQAPKVLAADDIERYQRIFDLQREARWAEADREIERLGNRLLVGHVLAGRYLHPDSYRSSYAELARWLDRYRDHPGAQDIHRLALKRKPAKAKAPAAPIDAELGDFAASDDDEPPPRARPARRARNSQAPAASAAIRDHVRAGRLDQAGNEIDRLERTRTLGATEADELRWHLATALFVRNEDRAALALAAAAARRARADVPGADWIAGMAAWRLGLLDNAAHHFEQLAHSSYAASWDRAAGAYWAARVMLRLRQPREVNRMLAMAARDPRTFYGLLALRQLGRFAPFDWQPPPIEAAKLRRLVAIPAVRRAVALHEIGEPLLAEQEMRRLSTRANGELAAGLLALASRIDVPAESLRLARSWIDARGEYHDAALYPLPPWEPDRGFVVDRALIFAFMRQESGFNARALSPAGASGLMQLMPRTASFVAGDASLRRQAQRGRLFAPEYNIELGQRYLLHLLEHRAVEGNLFMLAVAYNAGPGNLQRWLDEVDHRGDPLLFIEALPAAQTRNFVERVLTNLWIYRARLAQPLAELDAVAAGDWPRYDRLDGGDKELARNAD
jgi:soluble lytic murein transglycosylase-like protein